MARRRPNAVMVPLVISAQISAFIVRPLSPTATVTTVLVYGAVQCTPRGPYMYPSEFRLWSRIGYRVLIV